jgi:hypothetical protein
VLAPQLVDQAVERDHFAAMQQQDRQDGTPPRAAQFELLPPLDRLEPAKNPKLHAPLPIV